MEKSEEENLPKINMEDSVEQEDDSVNFNLDDDEIPFIEKQEPEEVLEEPVSEAKEEIKSEDKKPEEEHSVIYVVKVTTNKEDKALDMIADKIQKRNINVYAIARPHGLRGYIFLESPDRDNAEEAVFNLPYVKGIIPKVVSYEEVKPMLEPITAEVKIEKNDIVEIISEAFKKEKAKVVRVDKAKGDVVVSLLGSVVPIPVTVKLDNVRVIRRDEGEDIGTAGDENQ